MADEKRIRSLEDLLAEEGLLPLARAVDLVGQIAAALCAAHASGAAIDSVEPHAIQMTEEPGVNDSGVGAAGRMSVVGFLSAAAMPVRPGGPRASYLAPEVRDGEPELGRRMAAHQFSLAAIAYEMLAGCPAFPEEIGDAQRGDGPGDAAGDGNGAGIASRAASASASVRAVPPPVSELVLGVSVGLDLVFERALATEPSQRFPRLDDFVAALREVSDPGSVWDDGATVIWSPGAGDIEPAPPTPQPPFELHTPAPLPARRSSPMHAVATTQSARLAGAARLVRSSAEALAERWRARRPLAHMRQVEPNPPPRPPTTTERTSGALPPLAFASFPAPAIPSRRTQVSFLAAALVLVLGAVAVMSGSRVKPPPSNDNSASEGAAVVVPSPDLIRPRARTDFRPAGPRPQMVTPSAAPVAAPSVTPTTVSVAAPARHSPGRPARRHSRHAAPAARQVASSGRR